MHECFYTLGMLKVLSIIFSVYITLLTVVPCSDIPQEEAGVEKHEVTEHHDHNGDCDDDSCTPFCSCSCCHTNVTVGKVSVYHSNALGVLSSQNINVYIERSSTPHYNTLFRPPIS